MACVEQGNVGKEKFTEEVARYECVYHRNSKDFKDKNKKGNCWEKIREKFNLSTVEAVVKNCVRSLTKAIENATFWIGGRCSAKRVSKSGTAESTYCTQTIKQKFEIKVAS